MLLLFVLLVVIFLILNILDAISTYMVVQASSYRSERNPIARFFIKRYGIKKGIIIVKSVIILLIPLILYSYLISKEYEIFYVMIGINIVYLLVVLNNFKIAGRLKRY